MIPDSNHMTDAEYHAHPAMNYSRLKHLRESPLHFRNACDNPKPSSAAMSWGSLVHLLCFEPTRFDQTYKVTTETNKRLKAYKVAKAEAEAEGLQLVTDTDLETANRAACNVLAHPWVAKLLDCGSLTYRVGKTAVESMHFWEQPEGFGDCRMKTDISRLFDDTLLGCDLKTTRSTHRFSFRRDARMFGYDLQAAHYLHGLADKHGVELGNVTLDWRIIAVENVAPYDVTVYQFSVDTIDNALAEYDALGKLYRTCVENNNWPGRGRHDLLDLTWRA